VPAPLVPATRCPPGAELTQSVVPGAQQLLEDVGRRTTEVEVMRAALKRDESEAAAAAARLQETRAQLEEAMGQVSSGIPPCRG
jgi:Arc/MetJ-type ribon-helix-helix transcriptional regulator